MKEGELVVVMTDLIQNAPILGSPAIIRASGRYLHNQRLGKIVNLNESELKKRFLYHLLNSPGVRGQIKGGLRRNLWVTSPIIAAEPLIDRRNCGAAQKT